jgi:tRNA pseudouridine55 synthase
MKMMIKKAAANLSNCDFYSGEILLIDKPLGWTSFDAVNKIRRLVGVKKVGHAGTLDPMATGLLIICTGKKTKEISSFQDLEKTYTGEILLGKKSESMDLETELIGDEDLSSITKEDIYKTRDKFVGKILQVPPMYSAIKHKGKSLYNLARKGKTIELAPREIEISMFEILDIRKPYLTFKIKCSKGTYVRSIANDFGKELGCGGVLTSLRRTGIGTYLVDEALSITDFEALIKSMKLELKSEKSEFVS